MIGQDEKVPKLRCFSLKKFFLKKLKKGVDKSKEMVYNNICRHGAVLITERYSKRKAKGRQKRNDGSLAQLGEHLPYKQRVTGSSPVAPTIWPGSSAG